MLLDWKMVSPTRSNCRSGSTRSNAIWVSAETRRPRLEKSYRNVPAQSCPGGADEGDLPHPWPRLQRVQRDSGLLEHLRQFLLELGVGFAFVGSQYRLQVGSEEFFLDLLFYHLKLRAYVVVDLKMQAFRPEFAGYGKPDVMKNAA